MLAVRRLRDRLWSRRSVRRSERRGERCDERRGEEWRRSGSTPRASRSGTEWCRSVAFGGLLVRVPSSMCLGGTSSGGFGILRCVGADAEDRDSSFDAEDRASSFDAEDRASSFAAFAFAVAACSFSFSAFFSACFWCSYSRACSRSSQVSVCCVILCRCLSTSSRARASDR